jgi:hypothetical protein
MKLGNIKFGIQSVEAGQKLAVVNALPQLTVNSTVGKFVITAPVSKALNIAVGEHVMFLNNLQSVQAAISERVEDVVNYAKEHDIDIDTREGVDTLLNTFGTWYIAKGVKLFNANGLPKMQHLRVTAKDKEQFLNANIDSFIAENREALIEKHGLDASASDAEIAEVVTIDDVASPEVQVTSGSKTATTSASTGVGCQLNFTDSNVWNALKQDLADKTSKNRVFDVLLDDVEKYQFNNGKEAVEISIYPLQFSEDIQPIVREKKSEVAE